jgi:hypothetical protein
VALAGLSCLGVSGAAPASLSQSPRAWLMTAGFALLAAALAVAPRRSLAALWLAVVFTVYGGFSAVIAAGDPQGGLHASQHPSAELRVYGTAPRGYDRHPDSGDFANAALATVLAGIACIGAAAATERFVRGARERRRETSSQETERLAKAIVLLGFAGVAAALIRFAATQLPTDDLQLAIKSFWEGGSYLLLVATFAIPAFGLWLHAALRRGATRREIGLIVALMVLFLVLLVPTGQRTFFVAMLLAVVAVLVYAGAVSARLLAAFFAAGVIVFGISQAARTEISSGGGFHVSGFLSRVAPSNWGHLYGSQLSGFNWGPQIEANESLLHIPNSFPRALLKPVPRQLYPGKSQGFGADFTRIAYPQTYARHVSVAVPLPAETDYDFGVTGVVLVFAVLGGAAALAEAYWARGAPPVLVPLVAATIAWCTFALVRGDLANALVVSAGWLIPVGFASWWVTRPRSP